MADQNYILANRDSIFDTLKVIAIIFIVINHYAFLSLNFYIIGTFFGELENILRGVIGVIGNGIFFFASGYLLYMSNNKESKLNITEFMKKRIKRIFPLYWIALILTIILIYILDLPWGKPDVLDIIVNFSGLQIIFAPKYISIITIFWFVSALFVYYIIYAFIVRKTQKSSEIFIYSTFIISILLMIRISTGLFNGMFFEYFYVFFFGVIAANEKVFSNEYFKKFGFFSIVPIFICLSWIIITKPKMFDNLQTITGYLFFNVGEIITIRILLIISTIFFVYWLLSKVNKINTHEPRVFFICATAIYPIYLFHLPYFVMANYFLITLGLKFNFLHDFIILVLFFLMFVFGYYIQLGIDDILNKLQKVCKK